MRVFQEEIFGPVVSLTSFADEAQALGIANDTLYGLGAGVWTRDGSRAYRMGRGIKAGRVWTNCYHQYPAHAAFGGYKSSGIGRENHKMMLDHYQQTKNLLVSYSPDALASSDPPRGVGAAAWRSTPSLPAGFVCRPAQWRPPLTPCRVAPMALRERASIVGETCATPLQRRPT